MLTKQDTLSLIQPHYPRIVKMVLNARDRLQCLNDERHVLRKTSVANVYRDLLVDEARREFTGMESQGVTLVDHSDTSFFIEFSAYDNGEYRAVWAKLKKVRKNLLTSNIPTQKSVAFSEQQHIGYACQPYLEGEDWQKLPKPLQPSHLNIGHQWNELGTDVQSIFLTSPNGKSSIAWFEHIDKGEAGGGSIPVADDNVSPFPYELEITQRKPKRVVAKLKGDKDQKEIKRKANDRKS